MKPKKSNRANLENKRGIFLQIGLLISLTLVIAAFEWSSEANYDLKLTGPEGDYFELEYIPPTREKTPKPPPPLPKQPDILVLVEEIDPNKDEYEGWEAEPGPGYEMPLPELPPEEEEVETLPPFQVSEQPGFRGEGLEGFRNWVLKNLSYPEIAAKNGISGTVIVQFTVNHLGTVKDVIILRGVDPALDKETIRVVSASPDWSPGKRGIRAVNVVFTMPISFVLQ